MTGRSIQQHLNAVVKLFSRADANTDRGQATRLNFIFSCTEALSYPHINLLASMRVDFILAGRRGLSSFSRCAVRSFNCMAF